MTNNKIYKRIKVNWWMIIIFGGFHAWMIFAYIHKWGNNPISNNGLIIMSIIWIFIYIFLGRFKVIVDDNYAVFRSDVWIPVKIPISMIKNVSVKKAPLMEMNIPGSNLIKYQFDFFVPYAVKIQMKNGKIYQIAIKDAERIKDEIEKRMITIDND